MNNIYNAIQNLYNMDKTTWQEVLAELYNLVSNIENKFDLFEVKFGPLLGEQVTRELKKMYDDGSLASLINDVLLKDINKKVDTFKTEVNEQLDTIILEAIKKGDTGILDLNIFNEEARKILLGQTQGNINSVLGFRNVKNYNIDYENITADRTTFLTPSINLLNPREFRLGGYYSASDGTWKVAEGNKASTYIKCRKGEKYYLNTSNRPSIVFVDISQSFVTSIKANGWTEYFTVPDNDAIAYMLVNLSTTDANDSILMLTKDVKPTSYISYDEVTTQNIKLEDEIVDYNALSSEVRAIIESSAFHSKSVLLFGDSITETATVSDDGSEYTEGLKTNYPTYLNERLGFKQMWNYAKSGASYRNRNLQFRQFLGNQVDTAIANNREADIVIFSCGTNDDGRSFDANLDDYKTAMSKEISQLDKTKLYQSIRYSMYKIRKHYPNAICFVSTPLQRADKEPNEKLNEAIIKMGNRYNFIVIDCCNESGIVRDFEVWEREGRYLKDGLHPKVNGQKLQADLFESYLRKHVV